MEFFDIMSSFGNTVNQSLREIYVLHIECEGGVGWGLDISYSDILCNIFSPMILYSMNLQGEMTHT